MEFNDLKESFSINLKEYRLKLKPERKREIGGGRKGELKTDEDKFFAVLLYLKSYPTFDVFGFHIGLERTRAFRWVQLLLPVLEMTLKRRLVLPERKINSVEEFQRLFPEIKEIIVDGTERKINRPKSKKRQNKTYSGKKKITARKNIVVSDKTNQIKQKGLS